MANINEIYKMLNWKSNSIDQLRGIKLARELDDLSLLILPFSNGESKGIWENCARALYEISDERLEKYLPSLLAWLQDLNWPGALIILDRLKFFSGKKLKVPFIDLFTYAENLNNEEGLMWLDHLSELLDNDELEMELPHSVIEVLQKHYKNWGFWYDD
ncbi:MAG: DUF5071 domain-containing protein [Clostridia bacterium]|nr:DUF5071 domain-containing protein [Clostridia bacterium]